MEEDNFCSFNTWANNANWNGSWNGSWSYDERCGDKQAIIKAACQTEEQRQESLQMAKRVVELSLGKQICPFAQAQEAQELEHGARPPAFQAHKIDDLCRQTMTRRTKELL